MLNEFAHHHAISDNIRENNVRVKRYHVFLSLAYQTTLTLSYPSVETGGELGEQEFLFRYQSKLLDKTQKSSKEIIYTVLD